MKLDDGEVLKLDINPNEKILVIWFFTKMITYSVAAMFFIFMAFFFINTWTLTEEIEAANREKTDESALVRDEKVKEIKHPFIIIIDHWQWALAVVFLISIATQLYFVFLKKTYRYIITDRRCIFIGGILKRVERSVPHKKITDIQRSQNILERMLGIWNVQIYTPGTASMQLGNAKAKAELNFDGLSNSEELYELINKHAQLNS